MKFIALTKGREPRSYIVEAPSWFDARGFCARMLKADPADLECIETEQTRPDAELRWVESDAGSPPNRHLEVRFRVWHSDKFGEWLEARAAAVQTDVHGKNAARSGKAK